MKSIYLIILFLLPAIAGAKEDNKENTEAPGKSRINAVGLRPGITFSNILPSEDNPWDPRYLQEYAVGITFQRQLSPRWFLSSGLFVKTKGHRVKHSITCFIEAGYNPYFKYSARYFSMPLLINIQYTPNVSVYAGAGVYGAYLYEAYSLLPALFGDCSHVDEIAYLKQDYTDYHERWDFGVAAQAGVTLPLNECTSLDLQVMLSQGVVSIVEYGNVYRRSLLSSLSFQYQF